MCNENDAHGIEKLLLKTQVSLTIFLQSEVKIIHIIVQDQDGQKNNIYQVLLIRLSNNLRLLILWKIYSILYHYIGNNLFF